MAPHDRNEILEMLRKADAAVADGAQHLSAQEARVTEQELSGRRNAESARLLRNMRETQSLMMSHVRLLKSELPAENERGEGGSS
jgi:hypothetical protein